MSNEGKRWRHDLGQYEDRPDVDSFLEAIAEVCKAHGMSIGHEDCHGCFIVYPWDGESGVEDAWVGFERDRKSST